MPDQIGQAVADVTFLFHWGPHEARSLPISQLAWWKQQAARLQSHHQAPSPK